MSDTNKKLNGYTTLKAVVATARNLKGDYSARGFNRMLQIAITGYKQLNLYGGITYDAQWLTLSDVKKVSWPNDCVSPVAVGIPYRGKLWTFTHMGELIDPLSESEGVEALDADKGETSTVGDGGYIAGYGVAGGRNKVNIKVDDARREIIINGFSGTQVLLYYKSTGVGITQETIIPAIAEEALRSYILWQDIQYQSGINANEKMMAKNAYENAYQTMIDMQMPSLDELYDAIYEGYVQAPKR